jgi:hypothetical protein
MADTPHSVSYIKLPQKFLEVSGEQKHLLQQYGELFNNMMSFSKYVQDYGL